MEKKVINKIVVVLLLIILGAPCKSQISLIHTFQGSVYSYFDALGTDFRGYVQWDNDAQVIRVWDKDFVNTKTISSSLITGTSVDIYYPSQKIFNNDGALEFVVCDVDNNRERNELYHTFVINESGQLIYDFGYGYQILPLGYYRIGDRLFLVVLYYDYNTETDTWTQQTKIYSCGGTATNAIPNRPQNPSYQLNIYPNPTQDRITIEMNPAIMVKSAIVTSENGSVELTIPAITNNYQIDVSMLPKGIHFVNINTENGTISKCFVRQ